MTKTRMKGGFIHMHHKQSSKYMDHTRQILN